MILGLIRDLSNSYVLPLTVGALIDAIGGLVLLPLHCTEKYYDTKHLDKQLVVEETLDSGVMKRKLRLQASDPVKGSLIELYGGPEIID